MFKPDRDGYGMHEELRARSQEVAEPCNLLFGQDSDLDYEAEFYGEEDYEDDEGPFESLLRHAQEIEAGLMPGWKLDRSQAGALLWTTPSGWQYKSTLDGSSYTPYPALSEIRHLPRLQPLVQLVPGDLQFQRVDHVDRERVTSPVGNAFGRVLAARRQP